jgi:hypothetical protein
MYLATRTEGHVLTISGLIVGFRCPPRGAGIARWQIMYRRLPKPYAELSGDVRMLLLDPTRRERERLNK